MNKEELERSLIALGINTGSYTLNGSPYNDSSWVLERIGFWKKKWIVFNFERGKCYNEKLFNTEDEACDFIYEKLKQQQEVLNKFNLKNF